METMERKVPKSMYLWNKKAPKALENSAFRAFKRLVRMRSAVRIRPAAPETSRFQCENGWFSLYFETILLNLIFRIYV
nr:hypothetical protein [uncultured Oscillibacter sp.]